MIYVNQANAPLRLDTGIDLTGATQLRVLYTKPGGKSKGFWPAVAGVNPDTKLLSDLIVTFTNSDLNVNGVWEVESYVLIGGQNAIGNITQIQVEKSLL